MNNRKLRSILFLLPAVLILLQCSITPDHRGGSYLETAYWHRYQRYLPQSMRFTGENLPIEEYTEILGHSIHIDRYGNDSMNCKFILLHGAGGNGRVLGPIAVMLFREGCTVVSPDMPGYGLTAISEDSNVTYDTWVEVVSELMNRERKPGQKLYVMGLSIGGMLAYHGVAKNGRADGLMVTTLADVRKQSVRDAVAANLFLSKAIIPLSDWFSFVADYFYLPIASVSKMELITNDPEFSAVFANDPHAGGGWVSSRFLRTFMSYEPFSEPQDFKVCPVWMAHPGLDPWTPLEMSQEFFDQIAAPKKLILLEGAGHLPYEEPGRTQLEKAMKEMIQSEAEIRN